MNFFNRQFWNNFSSVPVNSPASSVSSTSPSKSFINGSVKSISVDPEEINHFASFSMFGKSTTRNNISNIRNQKVTRILNRIYSPSDSVKDEYNAVNLTENSTPEGSSNINDTIKLKRSTNLDNHPIVRESSLSLDMTLVNKRSGEDCSEEEENSDDESVEIELQVGVKRKTHNQKYATFTSSKDPVRGKSQDSGYVTSDAQSFSIPTKNLQNTNSVLINRAEFDILLSQKLQAEQEKRLEKSAFNNFLGVSSYKTNQDLAAHEEYVHPFICPEGITRVPFQNISNDRLSSIYWKYDENYDNRTSISSATTLETVSSSALSKDYNYKQRLFSKQKQKQPKQKDAEQERLQSSISHSDECGPTPTNSPSRAKSRKYKWIK